MNDSPVEVCKIVIENTMRYQSEPVLHYRIEYPRFRSMEHQAALEGINAWYRDRSMELQRKYESELYKEAAELYEYSKRNDVPFHMFDAVSVYELTYNMNELLSLYTDHYIYSGGAHGTTVRTSDTWDITNGSRVDLYEYAADPVLFRTAVIENITEQIARQMETEEGMYFEDYPRLIAEHFLPENFYVTPQGIVVYYQQYEIAPYASGIPAFVISF